MGGQRRTVRRSERSTAPFYKETCRRLLPNRMLYRPVADSAHSEHQNSDEQGNVQMRTSFVTKHPMSLDEAARLLRDSGCTVEIREDYWAVAKVRDGNYFHLTDDPECYTTLSIDLSADELTAYPTKIHD